MSKPEAIEIDPLYLEMFKECEVKKENKDNKK